MRLSPRTPARRTAIVTASALALGTVLAAAGVAVAAALEPDGVHLVGVWADGGSLELELEDRNTEPVICFIWDHPAPQDGDSIASRILTLAGAEVVELGSADQWVDGAGEGCEIPADDRYEAVFADPSAYVVEVRVVEEQGTRVTAPLLSRPLTRG